MATAWLEIDGTLIHDTANTSTQIEFHHAPCLQQTWETITIWMCLASFVLFKGQSAHDPASHNRWVERYERIAHQRVRFLLPVMDAASGGEFDRERDAVQLLTDFCNGRRVIFAERKLVVHGLRALHEEPLSIIVGSKHPWRWRREENQ